jgi:hypothetical protein
MMPLLSPPPHGGDDGPKPPAFPVGWRWDARLEYDSHGFLQPQRSLLERLWRWICGAR